MDRWACIDAFSFSLQILLSQKPQWRQKPAAVLARDHRRAAIVDLNHHARSAGLRRGMRYGEALALVSDLCAKPVASSTVRQRSDELAHVLTDFSPHLERDDEYPGTFWLDAGGLCHLYSDWRQWVDPLKDRLRQQEDIYVCVVIGFSRFGTFAVARGTRRSGLFETPDKERRAARSVPLETLGVDASTRAFTERLGIRTVGDLLALPPEGLRRRLGSRAFRLYRRARGDLRAPRQSFHPSPSPSRTEHLDHAERDANRLLFLIKRHLHPLLETLEERSEKLIGLTVVLHRRDASALETEIRPAEPTRDPLLLLDLIRLRLETLSIGTGITDVVLTAEGEQTTTEQMRLFVDDPPRDIDAANRALARLRAEFGDQTVLGITPEEGHLPESRFALAELEKIDLPDAELSGHRRAVRRFFPSPIDLRTRPDASLCAGPHTISGGWWVRQIHRDYHLAELDDRLLWIFYDHRRQRWYLHGEF